MRIMFLPGIRRIFQIFSAKIIAQPTKISILNLPCGRGSKMEIIVSPLFALDYLSNNNLSRIILLIIIVSKQSLAQSLYVNIFQFRFVLIIKKFVMVFPRDKIIKTLKTYFFLEYFDIRCSDKLKHYVTLQRPRKFHFIKLSSYACYSIQVP